MKKFHFTPKSRLLLIISILSILFFFSLADYIFSHDLTPIQIQIYHMMTSIRSPFFNFILISLTKSANPLPILFVTGASCLMFLLFKKYKESLLCMFTVLALTLSNLLLKLHYMRERPTFEHLIDESGYSFPSGHSMMSFGIAILCSFLLYQYCQKRSWAHLLSFFSFLYACLIGFSRVYVNVHFLGDVLGGFLAASSLVCLILSLYCRFFSFTKSQ